MTRSEKWVWVDLENTPHVLFLEPFIRRLRDEGWRVLVTAKPQAQTVELAAGRGLEVVPIGRGDFVGTAQKLVGGGLRALALVKWVLARGRPQLLLSSSRSGALAACMLRLPGIGLLDYEHAAQWTLAMGSVVLWMPDILRDARLPKASRRVAHYYAGLKENLYLDRWRFDREDERKKLGARTGEFLVVARPPAETAHYATRETERLWYEAVKGLLAWRSVRLVVSARNSSQRSELIARFARDARLNILDQTIPGPGLVAAADLVLGGGGTMNREAAVLGVPVWSVFCGPPPIIDEKLAAEGRLRWVRSTIELADALRREPDANRVGRGPVPEGFSKIFVDLQRRLNASIGRPQVRTDDRAVRLSAIS